MKIWIVFVGETLPIDDNFRNWRYSMLVEELIDRGHKVVRFAPSLNHSSKKQRCTKDTSYKLSKGYSLKIIKTPAYEKNVGISRIISYQYFSRRLLKTMRGDNEIPDVILTAIPSPGIFNSVMSFAQEEDVPVVLDIRDIWPDVFFSKFNPYFSKLLNYGYRKLVYNICADIQNVRGITGVSEEYVNWAKNCVHSKEIASKVFPIGYKTPTISKKERCTIRNELKVLGVNENDFLCTFVGQLSTTYDIETLITVSKMFRNTNTKIVICGTGEKQPQVDSGLKNNDNLIYLGWISQETISILLEMSSVGLVSYAQNATQSLPNKPFEYMAYSLPLISSLRGELDMIIDKKKNGLKYTAGSTVELYNAIEYLQKNEEVRLEMRKISFELFVKKYSNKTIYPLMADFIESMS